MRAGIVNASGEQIYWGNVNNAKFARLVADPGNVRVDVEAPDRYATWDGAAWQPGTAPPPPTKPTAPPPASGNSVPALRAEVNVLRQAMIDAGLWKSS